jgi:hypothetical protein
MNSFAKLESAARCWAAGSSWCAVVVECLHTELLLNSPALRGEPSRHTGHGLPPLPVATTHICATYLLLLGHVSANRSDTPPESDASAARALTLGRQQNRTLIA